jgi:hypothetical protein
MQDFGGEARGKETTWRIVLKWILQKWVGEACTGLNWLRIGTGGGRL